MKRKGSFSEIKLRGRNCRIGIPKKKFMHAWLTLCWLEKGMLITQERRVKVDESQKGRGWGIRVIYQKRAREPAKASKENDPFLTSTSHLSPHSFHSLTIKQLRKTVQNSHQLSVKPSKSTCKKTSLTVSHLGAEQSILWMFSLLPPPSSLLYGHSYSPQLQHQQHCSCNVTN